MYMRKRISKITALICAASFVFSFAGCGKENEEQTATQAPSTTATEVMSEATTAPASDAPVFMLEKLPEIGGYVDDIIYKRRYPDKRVTLAQGEDYGKLIPFVGSFRDFNFVDYETGEWEDRTYSVSKYGLMTDKGEIVVDAVYDWYDITNFDNGEYIIKLFLADGEESKGSLICNSDGSLVKYEETGKIHYYFDNFTDGYIIAEDSSALDWEKRTGAPKTIVYDNKFNKLFEIKNSSPSYGAGFSDGYMVVLLYDDYYNYDGRNYFVDTKGNIAFKDVSPDNNFDNGQAIVRKGDNYGLMSVDGKWIIRPIYDSLYKSYNNNCYFAHSRFGLTIFDLNGKMITTIDNQNDEDYDICIIDDTILLYDYHYDDESEKEYYTYKRYPSMETFICKETGTAVSGRINDSEYFFCDDGSYTYIVDIKGDTIAKLEGTGRINAINDELFALVEGHWKDAVRIETVYSLKGFKKLWSQKLVNDKEERTDLWFAETDEYSLKCYITDSYDEFSEGEYTFDLLETKTGKPILEGLENCVFFEVDGKTYISTNDGTYTYMYAPDMTVLMKVRNENAD